MTPEQCLAESVALVVVDPNIYASLCERDALLEAAVSVDKEQQTLNQAIPYE